MSPRRLLLLSPLVLVLLASVAWYWLLHTQSGARYVWGVSVAATGNALSATSVAGDVNSGVTVTGLEFRNENTFVLVTTVTDVGGFFIFLGLATALMGHMDIPL